MLTDEGTTCHCFEAIHFQDVSQFHQGIIKVSIAVGNHRHCQSTIAFYLSCQIRQEHIRHTTCNNGRTEHNDIIHAFNAQLRH